MEPIYTPPKKETRKRLKRKLLHLDLLLLRQPIFIALPWFAFSASSHRLLQLNWIFLDHHLLLKIRQNSNRWFLPLVCITLHISLLLEFNPIRIKISKLAISWKGNHFTLICFFSFKSSSSPTQLDFLEPSSEGLGAPSQKTSLLGGV